MTLNEANAAAAVTTVAGTDIRPGDTIRFKLLTRPKAVGLVLALHPGAAFPIEIEYTVKGLGKLHEKFHVDEITECTVLENT